MKLLQQLATKKKEIPLSKPTISTLHSLKGGKIDLEDDNGIVLECTYAGDDPKQMKHKYEIIIHFSEFPELFDRMAKLRKRFDDPTQLPEHKEPWT